MRDPAYGEASAASISRYQTTKGGDTTWTGSRYTGKSDPVPTFPLQSLRLGDNSNVDLDDAEKEAGLTRLDSNSQGAEQHLASSNANARAYKGIYIESETS